jgi:hypothetical protein
MVMDHPGGIQEPALDGVGGGGVASGEAGAERGEKGLGEHGEHDVEVDVEVDGAGQCVGAERADDLGELAGAHLPGPWTGRFPPRSLPGSVPDTPEAGGRWQAVARWAAARTRSGFTGSIGRLRSAPARATRRIMHHVWRFALSRKIPGYLPSISPLRSPAQLPPGAEMVPVSWKLNVP